jgi:hypothetical protein
MKKLLVPIMVLALVALTVPALAQPSGCNVCLSGSVTLNKTVTVNDSRSDCYNTSIGSYFGPKVFDPAARADAEVIKCDLNTGNTLTATDLTFKDEMCFSWNGFTGIGQSNQAAGNMNNQGNAVAVAAVSNAKTYASALTSVTENNHDNHINNNNIAVTYDSVGIPGWPCPVPTPPVIKLDQHDVLSYSFNCFTGIGQSNQSAGNMNNQNNVVAVAAGVLPSVGSPSSDFCKDAVAVSATDLALNNCGNSFCVDKATLTNSMTGSFNGFTGIGQSNQSAGNMNNQANVISVAASVKVNP